jgi:hypothetical protein
MNKIRLVKVIKDTDLVGKINELSKIANNKHASIEDVKNSINEMRTIVNHAGLIFQTTQEIFNKTFSDLSNKINKLNEDTEEDEYSEEWVKFMHKTYEIDNEDFNDPYVKKISLTDTLFVSQTDWLKMDESSIVLRIGSDIQLKVTIDEIKELTFEYSSDILKPRNKNKRHLGPIDLLDLDIARLMRHPTLFKIEQNKIKSHIVYNTLLWLLLSKIEKR